jgi:hypothetical protein
MFNLVQRDEAENGYNPYGDTPEGFETKPIKEHPIHPPHPHKDKEKDKQKVKKNVNYLIRKLFSK